MHLKQTHLFVNSNLRVIYFALSFLLLWSDAWMKHHDLQKQTGCSIDDLGATNLANALKVNHTLSDLVLSGPSCSSPLICTLFLESVSMLCRQQYWWWWCLCIEWSIENKHKSFPHWPHGYVPIQGFPCEVWVTQFGSCAWSKQGWWQRCDCTWRNDENKHWLEDPSSPWYSSNALNHGQTVLMLITVLNRESCWWCWNKSDKWCLENKLWDAVCFIGKQWFVPVLWMCGDDCFCFASQWYEMQLERKGQKNSNPCWWSTPHYPSCSCRVCSPFVIHLCIPCVSSHFLCAGKDVGNDGAIAIADALKHNTTLQILQMGSESLTNVFVCFNCSTCLAGQQQGVQ